MTSRDGQENRFKSRSLIIALTLLILAIIILVISIVVTAVNNNSQSGNAEEEYTLPEGSQWDEIENEVTSELNEYIKSTDEKLKNATTNEEKAELYVDRAVFIQNNISWVEDRRFLEQIKSDFLAAEDLIHSAGTAYNLYIYATKYGDEASATYYYDLATQRGYVDGEGSG